MAYIKMKETLWHKHKNCEVAVERNYQAKKLSGLNAHAHANGFNLLQPALVCKTHNTWLKWLSRREAEMIEGVTK